MRLLAYSALLDTTTAVHLDRHSACAALAYAATVSLFVVANDLTTAANAIFLQYTAPIYVALFGTWLLGEPARRIDWICIVIALRASHLLLRSVQPQGLFGIIAALASGVSFALMVMLLRRSATTRRKVPCC